MRGYFKSVVDRAFEELWQPLTDHDDCPSNVFGEIYAGLHPFLREPEPEFVREEDGTIRNKTIRLDQLVADAMGDSATAEALLASISESDFESESAVLLAISDTFSVLSDVATDNFAESYLSLVRAFVSRYSLRYYVDEKARLWISFSGLATALFGQLRLAAEGHPHLRQELNAFEQALAECLAEPAEIRIKTTIQKQVNCLEAFGSQHQFVSSNTLGNMLQELKEIGGWPHNSLADAARQLNNFANDYPGIRHAGTYESATRTLDLRDLASVTLSLVGLIAYLADGFETQVGPAMRGDSGSFEARSNAEAPWPGVLEDTAGRT